MGVFMVRTTLITILLTTATTSLPGSFMSKISPYFGKKSFQNLTTKQLLQQKHKFAALQKLEKNTDFTCIQTDCPKYGSFSEALKALTKSGTNMYSGVHLGLSMGSSALLQGTLATGKLLFGAILGAHDIYKGSVPFIKQSYNDATTAANLMRHAAYNKFEVAQRHFATQKTLAQLDNTILERIKKF